MGNKQENTTNYMINGLIAVMALCLISVLGWIAIMTSHIPSIETKMEDIATQMTAGFGSQEKKLEDHEARIRTLELSKANLPPAQR